jgi:hypothetical protein
MGEPEHQRSDHEGELSPEWREHYAALAADWVREKGTLPPSLEALADWASEPIVSLEDELAFHEGRGLDPFTCRESG